MTPPPNPFPRGTYEHEYYRDRVADITAAQDRVEIAIGEAPEVREMNKRWGDAVTAGFDADHGHVSPTDRILLAQRDAMAARIHEQRGEMRAPEPEPEWLTVQISHPTGGLLRLRTNGEAWVLRVRGTDLGVGVVQRGEISNGVAQPRPEIVDAAAARVLSDPWGPEAPPNSPVFIGGPDGEPIEVNAADLATTVEPPAPADLTVIDRFRQRLRGSNPNNSKGNPS